MKFIRHALLSCVAFLMAACGPSEASIRLAVQYEEAWGLDQLEVNIEGESRQVGVTPELLVWSKSEWIGRDLNIEIVGLRASEQIASGRVRVRPIAGAEVIAMVTLSRPSCGAWCTAGDRSCDGDGVIVCEMQADGCLGWSAPTACPAATPYCSLGECRVDCIDECADGEARCDGPNGYRTCGDFDGDPCREWSGRTACGEGQSCNASGVCVDGTCSDQCTSGATECRGSGVVSCGDMNDDGCTEWGPAVGCSTGESCQGGACRPIESCEDECTANECVGDMFHECGQFDADPCLDRSPGLSCTPADRCLEGACNPTMGCTSTAQMCDSPPAQTCINANTLRVYDAAGECTAGECNYAPRDIACANCPSCDACAGVTCNTPPAATCANASTRRTFASTGTCAGGSCSYTPTDVACNAPPAATCADANTLRTFASTGTCAGGTCTYTSTDMPCLLGCTDGRCAAEGRAFEAYIKASNTSAPDDDFGDYFGESVSLSGDLLAVGAVGEDSSATGVNGDQFNNGATWSGAVYVFRRSATGTWAQEAYLKASNTGADDRFGSSVSLSGDLLAVGAPNEGSRAIGVNGDQFNNGATRSGAVYVFRRSATGTWAQEAYLKASNTRVDDYFGSSVSLSGGLLAVGAFGEDSSATGVNGNQTNSSATLSGAVYVFRRSATGTWAQEAYLKASNTGADDRFGSSVSLSGDLLAVGVNLEDSSATGVNSDQFNNGATNSGAVYVFRRSATGTWAQEAYLKASNTEAGDGFGSSVSLSGDLLAVGAPYEDSPAIGVNGDQFNNGATDSGAVYVFRRSATGTWAQEAYLKASNTRANDSFGSSVSLSGSHLAVGADLAAATWSGAAYVFRRSATGIWAQEGYVEASNQGLADSFGSSVSLSGDLLAVGARYEDSSATGVNGNQADNSATDSGAVYIYR